MSRALRSCSAGKLKVAAGLVAACVGAAGVGAAAGIVYPSHFCWNVGVVV